MSRTIYPAHYSPSAHWPAFYMDKYDIGLPIIQITYLDRVWIPLLFVVSLYCGPTQFGTSLAITTGEYSFCASSCNSVVESLLRVSDKQTKFHPTNFQTSKPNFADIIQFHRWTTLPSVAQYKTTCTSNSDKSGLGAGREISTCALRNTEEDVKKCASC